MRNILIIVAGVLLLNAVLLYSGGFEYIKNTFEPAVIPPNISPEVVDTFKDTLEAEVQEKLGVPIEGYEPQMFLQVFPGLTESDFDGVEASIGAYVLADGQLQHQMDPNQLVHSAAGAITRQGIETLYRNVAARIGLAVNEGATVTNIIRAIITP